jgi:hypothetical protein
MKIRLLLQSLVTSCLVLLTILLSTLLSDNSVHVIPLILGTNIHIYADPRGLPV